MGGLAGLVVVVMGELLVFVEGIDRIREMN